MTQNQRYIDFAKKVMPQEIPDANLSLILMPLLKNTQNDLRYLIENKEFALEQDRKTKELEAEIKKSKLTQEEQNRRLREIEDEKNNTFQRLRNMQYQIEAERSTASAQLQRQLQDQQNKYNTEIDSLRRQVQSSSHYESQISSLRRQLRQAEDRAEELARALLILRQSQRVIINPGFMGGGFYSPW